MIGSRSTDSTKARRRALALAILAIVPTFLFADVLIGFNSFYYGDFSRYHYPLKHVLREIVLSGELPYWNPYLSGGQPLAANPAHEVFYPLTCLILLPSYRIGIHLLALAHIYIATFGMYALLRSMRAGRAAAVLGAISFGVGGLIVSTLSLFPFLFSAAWIPSIVLFARRYLLHRSRRDFALATFFLGVQFLVGEPMTSLQTILILGAFALDYARAMSRDDATADRQAAGPPRAVRSLGIVALMSIGALAVSAVQIVPGIDHFRDTQRGHGLAFQFVRAWSTPPIRAAELFYPDLLGDSRRHDRHSYWGVSHYGERQLPFFRGIYPGLIIAVLSVTGFVMRARGRGLFAAIGVASFVLAIGDHTPILRLLYELGIASTIRYPEKFLIMGLFAVTVLGALMVDRLLAGDPLVRRNAMWVTAVVAAFAVVAAGLGSTPFFEPLFRSVWRPPESLDVRQMLAASQTGWWLAAARATVLLLLLAALIRLPRKLSIFLFGAFVVVDLGSLVSRLAPRYPAAFYDEEPPLVRRFPRDRTPFRILYVSDLVGSDDTHRYHEPHPDAYWMWRNALPPLSPLTHGLRMAVTPDWDLTALRPSNELVAAATELAMAQSPGWLGAISSMSNVWYVSVNRPMEEAMAEAGGVLRNVQPVRFMEVRHSLRYDFATEVVPIRGRHDFVRLLKERPYSRTTAFVEGSGRMPSAAGVVRSAREWNNGARLEIETSGEAFLMISVTPHKYWRITIDGAEAEPVVTNIGYQGVVVPKGARMVEMRYHNPLIAAGAVVSIAALLALVLIWRTSRRPAGVVRDSEHLTPRSDAGDSLP